MNMFRKLISFVFLYALGANTMLAQIAGSVDTLRCTGIKGLQDRDIYVWKPSNYSTKIKYNVLYMHDGQMLFDASNTWNHKEWRVDEILDSLIKGKIIEPCIVVGICNVEGYRYADYFPEDALYTLPKALQDSLLAAQKANKASANVYVDYLANTLSHQINSQYSTNMAASSQCIAGASMGGLISWYAHIKKPSTFGNSISMSTHWPGGNPTKYADTVFNAFANFIKQSPNMEYILKEGHRFYFDCGDKTLDAYYPPLQRKIDKIFYDKKFDLMQYWSVYDTNAEHDETAWSNRFAIAMMYIWPNN
jgi:enterochelin esterase-like enzyme